MSRGRGRGGFNPSYYEENDAYGRTDESGGSRNHFSHYNDVQFHDQSKNNVNEHDFGPSTGNSRQEFYYNSHSAEGPNRMMKYMPDPRLQPKGTPHGVDQYPYFSNENPNHMMEEQICNLRGKSLKSTSPLVGISRLRPGSRNNERSNRQHLNGDRCDRNFSSNQHESLIVDENIQEDMNLDSFVHNILDHLDEAINYDNQPCHRIEETEEPEDFPTRYANYQRQFDDCDRVAVALPRDPRLQKASSSAQPSVQISTKKDSQPKARVKSEPREKITGPPKDSENNLKKALEDIRQRQQIPSTTASSVPSYNEIVQSKTSKNKTLSKPQSKKVIPPKVSSNEKDGKGPQNLTEGNFKSDNTRWKVVEDSGSRNSSRSSRNSSPSADRRGRHVSNRLVLGSPEWHRQVRMVDKPELQNRDSREREMRRVRRLSRSRSRSRSPRRSQRHFRSRSRSPISRRRRSSPDHRRWGPSGINRNSRSPVRTRDRRRSPPDHSNRNVIERTVIMRKRSRSFSRSLSRSRSPSRSSSQQQQNCKRLKDHYDLSRDKQQPLSLSSASNPVVNLDSPLHATQMFTRNYVVANQVDHVAHIVQPVKPPVTTTRYVVPPNNVPPNASSIPPLMGLGYYNQQPHYQTTVQQQIDIITYQQQQHHHHLQQQQFNQHQIYQQHLQQMNQNSVHKNSPSSTLIPIIHPAGVVHSPVRLATPQNPTSSSIQPITAPATILEGVSVEDQRTRVTRDSLLEKQANLIHQLLVLQGQQADLEMKQKTAEDGDYERLSNNIIEKAKFGKEMMVSAQSLEKIIQKHSNQLKEDLSEVKKTRSSNRYSYYDPQQHWCELCDVITDKLNDYLKHLHSKEHEDRLQSTGVQSTPWRDKKRSITPEEKGGIRIPFNGLQNLLPVKAWYCELCDVWIGDLLCAKLHMSSISHNDQHIKRNMERPDSLLIHMTKKQAALRRNLMRVKEEERVRNQQKEADKMKMDAEKKESAKKREEELKEKQRLLKEKWQDFVRNEEASNASVVELEGESTGEKNATSIQRSSDGQTSSIRLNIRTPLLTLKTPGQDTAGSAISSLMETSDSIEGQVILTEKENPAGPSGKQVFIDTLNKEDNQRAAILDVETSVIKQTENINRSGEISCYDGVTEKATADSLPVNSNDKEEKNNSVSMSRDDEASKDIPKSSEVKAAQDSLEEEQSISIVSKEISIKRTGEPYNNFVLTNTLEQIVPISQNDVTSAAETRAFGEAIDANPKLKERTSVPEQIQQVDENSQDQLNSPTKTTLDPKYMDVQGNIENVLQDSGSDGGVAGKVSEADIDGSNLNDGQEKRSDVRDGELIPKIEPNASEEISDCCVILEVNPKLSKIPELIDLESSNEVCDQQTTEAPKHIENSEHSVNLFRVGEEKCGGLLVGHNRSSTPCKYGEFLVLSETTRDSLGMDADSTLELSIGERIVEEEPGDDAVANQIP